MFALKTTILAVLLCIYRTEAQSNGNCGSDCALQAGSYNLTCRPSGTFASLKWRRANIDILICDSTGLCVPSFTGYNGYKISDSEYVLEIVSLNSSDSQDWTCLTGSVVATCSLVVREVVPNGTLEGSCVKVGDAHNISCSGLRIPGTPHVDLQIKKDSSTIVSTNTELSISTIEQNALQNNYSCSAQCLPTVSFKCEDNPTSTATPGRPTTPTPGGICRDINCNLFLLLLLLLLFIPVLIIVVIIRRRRKKKKPKTNSNEMSDEVQVNNDKSDQMRL